MIAKGDENKPAPDTQEVASMSSDPFAPVPGEEGETVKTPYGGLSKADRSAAINLLRGGPSDELPGKGAARGRILRDHALLQSDMDNLVGRSGGMTEDQIRKELSKIDPAIADDWTRILHGSPVPGGWSQIGARPYWQDMQSLARAVNPNWLPQDADEIKRFTESYDTIPMTQIFVRSTRMGTAGATLLKAVNRAIDTGQITDQYFVNKWNDFKDGHLNDKDEWWGIFNAAQNYVMDSLAVSNGGKPYEGDIRAYMDKQFYMTGPHAIRRIVQQDADNALGVVEPLNEDFVRRRGRDSPHYSPKNIELLKGLSHLQPDGSFDTEDIPKELKGLAKGATPGTGGGGKVHDWKEYFQ